MHMNRVLLSKDSRSQKRVRPRRRAVFLLALIVAGILCHGFSSQAWAADDKKDREARRIQLLEQRFEQEKAQWQSEKADLEKKLAEKDAMIATLKAGNDKSALELESVGRARAALAGSLAETNRNLNNERKKAEQTLQAKNAELEQFMKARQQERLTLNTRYEAQAAQLTDCTNKNEHLIKVAHQILDDYRNKGVWDAFKEKEPVIGIGDTELFNVVQDYRDQIGAEQFAPGSSTK